MSPDLDILRDLLVELVERKEWAEARSMMIGQHPADLSEIISEAPERARKPLFDLLEEDLKPDVLAEMESHVGTDILAELSNAEISDIVEEMEPDDAADVLSDLSKDRAEQVLDEMDAPESHDVRELLRYGEDTAGGIMTTNLVRFSAELTVAETIDQIAFLDIDEPFYYIYITDHDGKLVGVIGLWELLKRRDRQTRLGEIAHRDPIAVHADVDQEETAQIMTKYDLTSLPVIDKRGRLLGRITVDDVMDVMEEEATEDILRMGGTSGDESLSHRTPLQACRFRLPWLLITLATGFVTSFLFKEFIDNLDQVLVLSFFVPIVMAMGGNTGIQSSTLIIRRIALGTMESDGILRILFREISGALLMGLICGTVIALWAAFLVRGSPDHAQAFSPLFLGTVVGVSLMCAMVFAAVFGAFTPIMLEKFKIDPAVASGPFVTSSNDIFALLIYYGVTFGLIKLALRFSGGG